MSAGIGTHLTGRRLRPKSIDTAPMDLGFPPKGIGRAPMDLGFSSKGVDRAPMDLGFQLKGIGRGPMDLGFPLKGVDRPPMALGFSPKCIDRAPIGRRFPPKRVNRIRMGRRCFLKGVGMARMGRRFSRKGRIAAIDGRSHFIRRGKPSLRRQARSIHLGGVRFWSITQAIDRGRWTPEDRTFCLFVDLFRLFSALRARIAGLRSCCRRQPQIVGSGRAGLVRHDTPAIIARLSDRA